MRHVRAGDGVARRALIRAAELADGAARLVELCGAIRPFHGEKHPARAHKRQAQLAQQVQPRDRARDRRVELPAQLRRLLGARMQARHVREAGRGADVAEKAHALIQTVEQRERNVRLRDLQRQAGKARARADVDDRLAGKRLDRQQGSRIEKVQLRHVGLAVDGRQVHDLAALVEQRVICLKTGQHRRVERQAQRGKARAEQFFHVRLRIYLLPPSYHILPRASSPGRVSRNAG